MEKKINYWKAYSDEADITFLMKGIESTSDEVVGWAWGEYSLEDMKEFYEKGSAQLIARYC